MAIADGMSFKENAKGQDISSSYYYPTGHGLKNLILAGWLPWVLSKPPWKDLRVLYVKEVCKCEWLYLLYFALSCDVNLLSLVCSLLYIRMLETFNNICRGQ